jgi:AraC family transcriptional regulator
MSAKYPAIVNDPASHRILVADVASGTLRPVARPEWLVLSSDHAPWTDSLVVEQYRKPSLGGSENSPRAHHINIRLNPSSIMEWRIAGGHPQRQLIPPGHVHIAPAGVPKWGRWWGPVENLVLALKPAFVQQVAYEVTHPDRLELTSQRGIGDPQLLHLGLALRAELTAGCPGGRLYGESLATALAVHLVQHYTACPPPLPSYHGGVPKARLRRVLEYIQEHLDCDLPLAALAAVAQMSPYYFSRLFKQSTGLSPHQYILQQRIEWAKRLLADVRLPIAAIAYRVGFPSQAHLTKIFRRWVGTTPQQYRQRRSRLP